MAHTRPLSPGFGLEASDIDVSRLLSDAEFADLEQTFFRAQVPVLRAQSLTPAQVVAFAQRFGPPEPHVIDQFHHPDDPNILILSNRTRNGEAVGLADAGTYFHTDYSYLQVPARATMLYSIEVPKSGGNTLFANQHVACDDLPEAKMPLITHPVVRAHPVTGRKALYAVSGSSYGIVGMGR